MIMKQSPKVLSGLLAFSAVMAMPIAFAQEQTLTTADPAATTQSKTAPAETQAAEAAPEQPSASIAETSAQPSTETAKPKTWTNVDGDKDGNISKTEAAAEPAVNEIFDMADSNKDSKLTPDEYKAYVAKAHSAAKPAGNGG